MKAQRVIVCAGYDRRNESEARWPKPLRCE